ncbi:hypothetical protein [Nonomuraea sp. NPDC050202]|uniref:hypothetical protein n=1 Tax=Nonomuraea sp. NPDC050202 TaxID=3155035 RepID=UPI0033F130AD
MSDMETTSRPGGVSPGWPFADQAEYDDARKLAAARQQIAHEATYLDTFDKLTPHEQEMSTVDALHYLRAGRRAGLFSERASQA